MTKMPHLPFLRRAAAWLLIAGGTGLALMPAAAHAQRRVAALPAQPRIESDGMTESILAVVNGDVITRGDVTARARLFALTTGLPMTPDVVGRLRPQILRQLIDERLRLQEVQRRKIVVSDKEIADAIGEVEGRNQMPRGALRARLQAEGVAFRTLVDQIRVQIGWTRVLREELGPKAQVTDAEVAEQTRLLKAQTGKPEFRVSEIFVPIEDPAHAADARSFADTVISQLRSGAPFAVAAAEFSQSQTALQGGDLGWMRADQLDPEVAAVVTQMPVGAVSNPIQVPGGLSIVTLRARREVGRDMATMLKVRQVFIPFPTPLTDPSKPTEQQLKAMQEAQAIMREVHSCEAMEAAAQRVNSPRPADPGEVRLENANPPAFRAVMASLPPNRTTPPLVSNDGIALLMVCSREQRNVAEPSKEEISARLLNERVELTSRQLQRDLRRRAIIEQRG